MFLTTDANMANQRCMANRSVLVCLRRCWLLLMRLYGL
jgi:hypothetical protein